MTEEKIIKKFKRFPSGSQYIELKKSIKTQEEFDRFQKELEELIEK